MNDDRRRPAADGFLILGMTPKALTTAAIGLITGAAIVVGVLLSAVHEAIDQVKTIKEDLQRNPPSTAQDVDELQRRIDESAQNIRDGVRDQIGQIDEPVIPRTNVVVKPATPAKPSIAPVTPLPPTSTPVPPKPTPAPRLLPPLPPLLP